MSFCFQVELLSTRRVNSARRDEFVHFAAWNKRLEFRSARPLNESSHWMVRSCGFATSNEALQAADIVCQALLLAGAKNRYGVSLLGTKITDDKSQFAVVSIAELGVAQPAFDFTNQLTAFAGKPPLKQHQRVAAELINDVLFQHSIETRFLLGIVAIETLCAPSKQKKEGNSKCCQRVIQRYLNNTTADNFAKLYTKRNDFAHEGLGKGVLDGKASEARQIATELLLAQI